MPVCCMIIQDLFQYCLNMEKKMKIKKLLPQDSDLVNAGKALKRAARNALKTAKKTNTPCYIVKDGVIVDIAKRKCRTRGALKQGF